MEKESLSGKTFGQDGRFCLVVDASHSEYWEREGNILYAYVYYQISAEDLSYKEPYLHIRDYVYTDGSNGTDDYESYDFYVKETSNVKEFSISERNWFDRKKIKPVSFLLEILIF